MEAASSRHPVPYPLPLTRDQLQGFVSSGFVPDGQLLVFMASDVYQFIRSYSQEHAPREVGGVLLGQYCEDEGTRFVIVPTVLACRLGSATAVSISFPPEFWQQVEEVHASEYPGLLRIGPYHSHPGYGVHPSSTDHATILGAFSRPHHVSVIYDPHADQMGYTSWRDGQLTRPAGCFVYEHPDQALLVQELMEQRPV